MANITAVFTETFTGLNGIGSVSISDLKVGDLVLAVYDSGGNVRTTAFASIVNTAGDLQQISGSDYSSTTFTAVFVRS